MPKSGFTKIDQSDALIYGPRALLLCGFGIKAQSKFTALLNMLGLSALPLIWASEDQAGNLLEELFQRKDGFGAGVGSQLPRAIIVAGIQEKELHRLMSGCRKAGMGKALWATLTPTSAKWPLSQLITELQAEHRAMSKRKSPSARR